MDKYFEHYTTFGFETLRKNTKKGEDMLSKEELFTALTILR